MLAEGEAAELLAEIFNHIISFELAMYEHINAGLLLEAQTSYGLFLKKLFVACGVKFPGFERCAHLPDFRSLGE